MVGAFDQSQAEWPVGGGENICTAGEWMGPGSQVRSQTGLLTWGLGHLVLCAWFCDLPLSFSAWTDRVCACVCMWGPGGGAPVVSGMTTNSWEFYSCDMNNEDGEASQHPLPIAIGIISHPPCSS